MCSDPKFDVCVYGAGAIDSSNTRGVILGGLSL
jgi:hypothetical protein